MALVGGVPQDALGRALPERLLHVVVDEPQVAPHLEGGRDVIQDRLPGRASAAPLKERTEVFSHTLGFYVLED